LGTSLLDNESQRRITKVMHYNSTSRKRHFNKEQKTKSRKWQTKEEDSKFANYRYKVKKQDLILRELDDEIRTVIAERVSEKIF